MGQQAIDKLDKLIDSFDLFRQGHAGLRKLLIAKAKVQGLMISDQELGIEVEKIRLKKERERKLAEEMAQRNIQNDQEQK